MRAWLLGLVAVPSLLLCVALSVAWVRSYFVGEVVHFAAGPVIDTTPAAPMVGDPLKWRHQYSLHSGAGKLQLVRRELQDTQLDKPGRTASAPALAVVDLSATTSSDRAYSGAGFAYFNRHKQPFNTPPVTGWYWGFLVLSAPYWALVALSAVAPTLWFMQLARRRRRRLRRRRGQCPHCGYDVRASAERCPECGQPLTGSITPAAAAS